MSKSRYWSFLMYEDSRPKNWYEIMESWYIPIAISPKHDKDLKENGSGEYKKAHYHVMVIFNGPTTYKCVLEMANQIGAEYVEQVRSLKGAYEYWVHKNNPNKAQYKEEDRININFSNIEELIGYSEEEIDNIKNAIIQIINKEDFTELKEIYDYCNKNELIQARNTIMKNTIFINAYLKSRQRMRAK